MQHHNDVHGEPVLPALFAIFDFYGDDVLRDLMEFVGPYTSKIGDVPYITFTQYGVKEEFQSRYPDENVRCWTDAEAMWRFKRALRDYLRENPARQLAWRCKPALEKSEDGDFVVRCRFALLGRKEAELKAVA